MKKVWEEIREFYIYYFIRQYKDVCCAFLVNYKLIKKSRSKKGLSSKYLELINNTSEKEIRRILTYDVIKKMTDSDDKTLNMDIGGILAKNKYNEILERTHKELETLNEKNIYYLLKTLYEKCI